MRLANGNLVSVETDDDIVERNVRYDVMVTISSDSFKLYIDVVNKETENQRNQLPSFS